MFRIVDLTWPLFEGMPTHPLHPETPKLLSGTLQHRTTSRWMGESERHGAVSYANEQVVISGHMGTHIDAPIHADPKGDDCGSISLYDVISPATVLRLGTRCKRGSTFTEDDLRRASGDCSLARIVLLHTRWSEVSRTNPKRYFHEAPGMDASAADWLRAQGVRCVGIDAPSVDAPKNDGSPAHMCFLRERPAIYIVENLCSLDEVPDEGALFCAAPLPMSGITGSPVRACAIMNDSNSVATDR